LDLVNDIQVGLRETFRFLTNTDIESTSFTTNLPYISNTYGEEKDHEISVKILELVKTKINSILNSMGGSTIPLPISLSSSSIATGTPTITIPTSLNNKFLNSRFASNAELIASSLCSSNNNSNANIKINDEMVNDIAFNKKLSVKKGEGEDLMEVDDNPKLKIEDDVQKKANNNFSADDFMNLGNTSLENPVDNLDLDF